MKLNIAVLAGEGIGPEIMKQGVAVMQAIAEKFNHEFTYNEAICGAHAIDEVGNPIHALVVIHESQYLNGIQLTYGLGITANTSDSILFSFRHTR